MKNRKGIVWFRQDLRIHDNEALIDALKGCDEILPVYIFDERIFKGKTGFGFPKTGNIRAQFIIESVEDLRQSLRKLGTDLIVRVGKPEEELFHLARTYKFNWIFCNRERTQEEVQVQDALEKELWSVGQEIRYSRGKMLYYTGDLPFPVTHIPDTFTHFRKEVERFVGIRDPLASPTEIAPFTDDISVGEMPTLEDFGLEKLKMDKRAVLDYKGGETAALARLHYYFWETDLAKTYKETRNEMIGGDYSTKFSAWLAQGCLSPKSIYQELSKYEATKTKNKSTYWVFFELMWRDFFRFMAKKHGNLIFQKTGTRGEEKWSLNDDDNLLQIWIKGRTGIPFIDANMQEIAHTGFMSNRGRQVVASFLINDLKVNWQMGAEYFESQLIDYDPASNYGNWNYIAGVGSDPREDRYFNILKQGKRYDAEGEFVKLWLPELADIPTEKIHRPDYLTDKEQDEFGVKIGVDYPKAMISMEKWR
jgi:deoxyribodipyrimidine photo-lyase